MENYESIDKALNISEPDVVPIKKESPKIFVNSARIKLY